MRMSLSLVLAAISTVIGFTSPSFADDTSYFGQQSRVRNDGLLLGGPVLAPLAHVRFCLQYPEDCKQRHILFRGGPIRLDDRLENQLVRINLEVNRSILPQPNRGGVLNERWLVAPARGDCNDYAVTKQHRLLALGWPQRALLLAEVALPSGEHHLVVVVRTSRGNFVLDNLAKAPRRLADTNYRWIRAQSTSNPRMWLRGPQGEV